MGTCLAHGEIQCPLCPGRVFGSIVRRWSGHFAINPIFGAPLNRSRQTGNIDTKPEQDRSSVTLGPSQQRNKQVLCFDSGRSGIARLTPRRRERVTAVLSHLLRGGGALAGGSAFSSAEKHHHYLLSIASASIGMDET